MKFSIVGNLGRSPGEGNGNPLQYSCLENPMDRGAWWVVSPRGLRVRHDLATKQQQLKLFVMKKLTSVQQTIFEYSLCPGSPDSPGPSDLG